MLIKHIIAFFYLFTGSISDIKTREVADWSNFGLITIGFAANLIFSLTTNNWWYIINSIIGFAVFWLLSIIFFYTGQWGGGDAKMLMGLGSLYGLGINWQSNEFLVSFIMNTLIAGALFGIIWSTVAGFRNFKQFKKAYRKLCTQEKIKKIRLIIISLGVIGVISFAIFGLNSYTLMFLSIIFILLLTFFMWLFIKSVENSCMYKLVEPAKLTEGDWIAKNVKYEGKVIVGPKSLGIENKEIRLLKKLYKQNKIKKILVKEGIPFVPSFFIGWILTIIIGNIFNFLI